MLSKLTYLDCNFKTIRNIISPTEQCTLMSLKTLRCHLSKNDGPTGEFDISPLLWLKSLSSLQSVLLIPNSDCSD
jgi:hypothetical protein